MGNTIVPLLLLPEEVLIQILLWLPVISLLRFKSVCKSWCALIENSFFIDLHTATTFNSSSSSKFDTFILQAFLTPDPDRLDEKEIKMYLVSSGSGSGGNGGATTGEDDDDDDHVEFYDLEFSSSCDKEDLMLKKSSMRMVGSCNGLICLHDSEHKAVYLWNPATRQFRILPKSITFENGYRDSRPDFVAFGFDVKTKDYKVVQISPFHQWEESLVEVVKGVWTCLVQVYSLSTDSWRLLEGINSLPAFPKQFFWDNHGIYLNGSHFFVGNVFKNTIDRNRKPFRNNCLLLSFDFTKEIFTTIHLPDHDTRQQLAIVSYLGKKVAIFATGMSSFLVFRDCDGYEYYDIWLLNNEHGSGSLVNKESWTKLHSFRIENKGSITRPRCILNDGEFALTTILTTGTPSEKLQLFNLVTKEAKKDFQIAVGAGVLGADVYKQSLVSIIGGKCSSSSSCYAARVVGGGAM